MKRLWRFVKFFFWFVVVSTVALAVFLCCFEHRIPDSWLKAACYQLSNDDVYLSIDEARVRFPRKLMLKNVRLLDRTKARVRPVMSASSVDVRFSLGRLPWSTKKFLKKVTIRDLSYPRLPDGYYIPDSVEFPGQPDFKETDKPLLFDFPELDPFDVVLIRPNVLDCTPARVDAYGVRSTRKKVSAPKIDLEWPDTDQTMSLKGELTIDLDAQRLHGGVHGQARQANIRPLLAALDLYKSYPYIDGWTGVTVPVDAGCRFDVNLRNGDLHIALDLHPTGGAYNRVEMKNAHGIVDIRVYVRDVHQNACITVGPIAAATGDGRGLDGTIVYENINDIGVVNFNASSTTSLSNALAIADVMTDGTLDCIQPETPPHITIRGALAVDPKYAATNNLEGSVRFDRGKLFSIPLVNASTTWALKGTEVSFSNARAAARHGGVVTGSGKISVPGFKQDDAAFGVSVAASHLSLEDLANVFSFDLGDRRGTVEGYVEMTGPLNTNLTERINGSGKISCRHGHLAQLNLFAGLTDLMAKRVPGISSLVTQSQGSLDFTIKDGVFSTDNLLIEGKVFSISGSGSYSIPADKLDFKVRVQLLRNDSILGKLTHPVMWPFSKLLMEFRLFGSLAKPDWQYVSIIDRLL